MVTGLEIQRREAVLDGKPFGDAGAYEKIVGRLSYAVDPEHPLHAQVADIALAPKNAHGRVEFSGDFYHPENGAPGDIMLMMGSSLPFARTQAQRARTGDPRLSIAERHASKAVYLDLVRQATQELIASRHVLAEDLEAIIERAGKCWDWVQSLEPGR